MNEYTVPLSFQGGAVTENGDACGLSMLHDTKTTTADFKVEMKYLHTSVAKSKEVEVVRAPFEVVAKIHVSSKPNAEPRSYSTRDSR